MKRQKLLAAALAMLMLLTACAGDPDTSSGSPAPSESASTVTDAGNTSAQPDESQPAGDEGAASTPSTEPEKEPDSVPEQTPDAEPEKEPEKEPAPEVTPAPEKEPEPSVEPAPEVTPTPDASETTPPVHTHEYENTVVNPTCTKDGYTEHKCACGESYKDTVKSATGHKYNDKVVAPTTSEKGYTLHTCSVCGDSYKDNYTDKLPAEKPGKDEYVNDGGEANTDSEAAGRVAGKMADSESAKANRPAPNPGADKTTAVESLNNLAFYTYGGLRFFDDGIAENYEDEGKFAKFVTHSDGRTGINVFGWRKSYDSSSATNACLNVVLEAFYYMTGDRQVAKALWDWIDANNINGGGVDSTNYGFRDVRQTSNGWIIEMNGIQLELDNSVRNSTILYFN